MSTAAANNVHGSHGIGLDIYIDKMASKLVTDWDVQKDC